MAQLFETGRIPCRFWKCLVYRSTPGRNSWFLDECLYGNRYGSNKVAQIQKAGYIPVATFILPENCWIEHYFAPQAKAEEIFRRKHAGSRIVEELIISNHHEAELYSKYKAYYGYAFFICKKGFSLRRWANDDTKKYKKWLTRFNRINDSTYF